MDLNKYGTLDNRPTVAEWPIDIKNCEEIPSDFSEQTLEMMHGDFQKYCVIYAPVRKTAPSSFVYLFGYGQDRIFYIRETRCVSFHKKQIQSIEVSRELLNIILTIHYLDDEQKKNIILPYVASVYYLYDPFLNWLLDLEKDFSTSIAERKNPRPEKLFQESLVMYNYSLAAYRLGERIETYEYKSASYRKKWMPWKKYMEEWLEVPMDRGMFWLHSKEYLTEYKYILNTVT